MRVPIKNGRQMSINQIKLHNSLIKNDLNTVRDFINVGDSVVITTDVWTSLHQLHIKINSYVVEKYPHLCIVEFPWYIGKDLIFIRRVLSYTELLLSYRNGTIPNISHINKSIDKEVEI